MTGWGEGVHFFLVRSTATDASGRTCKDNDPLLEALASDVSNFLTSASNLSTIHISVYGKLCTACGIESSSRTFQTRLTLEKEN